MKLNRLIVLVLIFSVVAPSIAQTRFRSGIFLHHSTGACIWGPNGGQLSVPGEIAKYNLSHSHFGSDSVKMIETWWPSGDNEWTTWHNIFDNRDGSNDILPFLASYPVIMIKSCFPSANMSGPGSSADSLNPTIKSIANYKWHWRSLISVMKGRPQNFFIIWTNAPNVAGSTNTSEAALSNAFCRWAKDTLAVGLDPVVGVLPRNIFVFDFFHLLAGADGMLPLQLASGLSDSHPNAAATTLVASQLVKQVFDAALAYESPTFTGIPNSLAFGYVAKNTTKKDTVLVINASINSLTIDSIYTKSSAFTVDRVSGTVGIDTLKVVVSFTPTTIASYTDTLCFRNSSATPFVRIPLSGNGALTGVDQIPTEIPTIFSLAQNYPNPFNPSTQIEFGIPKESRVKLEVYDVLGARVLTLEDCIMSAGYHSITVQAASLPSGLYLYRLTTPDVSFTRKMLLMK